MSMFTRAAKRRESLMAALRTQMDSVRIGNQSLAWYLSGWRLGVLLLLLAVIYPFVFTDTSTMVTLIAIGIYVLLALGLNIVVGYAGLLDLGYVAFFVIGSYTVAALSSGLLQSARGDVIHIAKLSFWLLLPVAALFAGVFGVLLGAPTLRLRGDYLAIVTLGFGEIMPLVFQNIPFFFGQLGLSAETPPAISLGFTTLTFLGPGDPFGFYFLTLALVALMVLAVSSLRDSSLGRAWVAIREDETAAAASGVNLVRTKLLAFGLGAVTGGIGGALNAAFFGSIAPNDFNLGISISILVMIVLGGIGSIPGVIVGAAILRYVDVSLLQQVNGSVHGSPLVQNGSSPLHFLANIDFNATKLLIYGIILLLMILLRPQGLIPNARRSRELKGIGAAPESSSAVALLEREEAAETTGALEDIPDSSAFAGAGSDAQGREG